MTQIVGRMAGGTMSPDKIMLFAMPVRRSLLLWSTYPAMEQTTIRRMTEPAVSTALFLKDRISR